MRIAVCDDDKSLAKDVKNILQNYFSKNTQYNAEIVCYTSSLDIEKDTKNNILYDAYFLDVIMDGKNGIRIASIIRSENSDAPIVFLTTSSDYALAAFGVKAKNYLLKPIDEKKLIEEIESIVVGINKGKTKDTPKMFSVPCARSAVMVDINNIILIKTVAHIFYFTLTNGTTVESSTMRISSEEFLKPILNSNSFLSLKRGVIINLNYVTMVNSEEFVLTNGQKIKPPRAKFVELRKQYFNFLANKEG